MTGRLIRFPHRTVPDTGASEEASRILAVPLSERRPRALELTLEEPETLLAVCGALRGLGEINPALVREESEFFYNFIESPERPIGLFDEREYFLGELALLAGAACRMLFRRDEATRWLDRSESHFRQTINALADWARVSYQRLALRVEERDFDAVLELVPSLTLTFRKLNMNEDALKARFLEGVVLMNLEQFEPAVTVFREICDEAQRLGNERLLAIGCNNLVQVHGYLGDSDQALSLAQDTLKLLYKLDNRVGLAKLQWGIGILLKTKGNLAAAVEAFQAAQDGFLALQMRSDVAALHLLLADVLLEMGNQGDATRHVLMAVPIIEAENMVPEGMAAFALLQESVRHKNVDRQALRDLHGYFRETPAS